MFKPPDDALESIQWQILEMAQRAARRYPDKELREAYLLALREVFKVVQGVRRQQNKNPAEAGLGGA